ncbi:MAG: CopG family transcriptional regulator [Acidobacteriota bacterium]
MYNYDVYMGKTRMVRTQIYLTTDEKEALDIMSKTSGKSQSELIRGAIDRYLEVYDTTHRMTVFEQTAGLWRNRKDLPDFESLRKEWDRSPG